MTDREVRQLTRAQLISLLAEVTGENEELKAEIGRLNEEVGKLTVTNEKLERKDLAEYPLQDLLSERQKGRKDRPCRIRERGQSLLRR